jgi:hypothetical protein
MKTDACCQYDDNAYIHRPFSPPSETRDFGYSEAIKVAQHRFEAGRQFKSGASEIVVIRGSSDTEHIMQKFYQPSIDVDSGY